MFIFVLIFIFINTSMEIYVYMCVRNTLYYIIIDQFLVNLYIS